MNYVKIKPGTPDLYVWFLGVTLLTWGLLTSKIIQISWFVKLKETIKSTKPLLVIFMILYSTLMLFMSVSKVSTPEGLNVIIPAHMTLAFFFLMSGKRFESNYWTPIRFTIDDLIVNDNGTVIAIYPRVSRNNGVQYFWKEDRILIGDLITNLSVENIPFMLIIESTNNDSTRHYKAISYDRLNEVSNLNITLSRSLVNRQNRTSLSHILIWQLFELYRNIDYSFEIPYNIKRENPDLTRLNSELENQVENLTPHLHHIWDYETMTTAAGYILDIITRRNQSAIVEDATNHEHALISSLFRSGLEFYHYKTHIDDTLMLCHSILLSSRFQRELEEKFWITINSTFADAAKIICNELKEIKPSTPYSENIPENTNRWIEEIQAIRSKPIENFIKYHDQLVSRINQRSVYGDEDYTEYLQKAFDGIIEMMNNQLNRTEYSLKSIDHAIDRRQYRKEIVSGVTLGLCCLVFRTSEV